MADRSRQLVDAYAKQSTSIAETLIRLLLAIWFQSFTGWRNEELVRANAAGSVARVDQALSQARRLARVYAIRMLENAGINPANLPPSYDTYERGGRPMVEVYERPAKQFIHELATGHTVDEALAAAETRLRSIAEADVRSVQRDEIQRVFESQAKVIGYRRVIHPERSKGGTCGLCIVAATQFYAKSDLMPLHDECKCEPVPITAESDPGLRLNREDLDALYAAAGSSLAEDLKRIRPVIKEHGELGPVLVRDGDHFRDVAEVNRDRKPQTPKFVPYERMTWVQQLQMWEAQRASSERSIAALEAARAAGTNQVEIIPGSFVNVRDIDKAIGYHRQLIERAMTHLL